MKDRCDTVVEPMYLLVILSVLPHVPSKHLLNSLVFLQFRFLLICDATTQFQSLFFVCRITKVSLINNQQF